MVKGFLYNFNKSMRGIIAFVVVVCGFAYMFVYPKESKGEIVPMMMVVLGYFFTANKDQSDQQKAEIAKESGVQQKTI